MKKYLIALAMAAPFAMLPTTPAMACEHGAYHAGRAHNATGKRHRAGRAIHREAREHHVKRHARNEWREHQRHTRPSGAPSDG